MNKLTILLLIILIAYALIREKSYSSPGLPFPDSPKKDIFKKKSAELDYFSSHPNPVKQPVNSKELDPKNRLLLEPSKDDKRIK